MQIEIPDELAAAVAEIAAKTGLDADAVDRILRLLAAHGVCSDNKNGRRFQRA